MTREEQRQEDEETLSVMARVWQEMDRQRAMDWSGWAFWILMILLIGGWMTSELLGLWG